MRVDELGCLARQQNAPGSPGSTGDSCFDTSEAYCFYSWVGWSQVLLLSRFIDSNQKLQRHPNTFWPDTISSDQAHAFLLASRGHYYRDFAVNQIVQNGFRTSNGNLVSVGLYAEIMGWKWLTILSVLGQMILFWVPVRWNDGNVKSYRERVQFGFRHHCGDYRLFKLSLRNCPLVVRRLVSKKTLKKMTRYYWEPEPNVQWLIDLDDKFVELL